MLDSLPITKREFNEIAIDLDLSDCNGSPELVAAFSRKAVAVTCTENEVLFQKGEPGTSVYLVRSGEVSLLLPIARTRGIGFRAKPGSLVGLPAAFGNEPYSMTAIAWEDSEIAVMSRERFCDLVASDHALSLDVRRPGQRELRLLRPVLSAGIRSVCNEKGQPRHSSRLILHWPEAKDASP